MTDYTIDPPPAAPSPSAAGRYTIDPPPSSAPSAPAPAAASLPWYDRLLHGAADPLVGMGQLAAHAGIAPVGEEFGMVGGPGQPPATAAAMDQAVRQRETEYQGRRSAAGQTGTDWWRLGGNVASDAALSAPLALIPGGAAVTWPRALLRGIAEGGAGGAAAGAAEPVTSDNYAGAKGKQIGVGAATGAATGGALGALARGLVGQSVEAVDNFVRATYARTIRPSFAGKASVSQIDRGAAQARQAVDSIVANKPNLRLTDEAGNETAGVLPKSLKQFGEAVEQTKAQIFQRYDALARQAGEAGVAVDLAPAVSELRSIASDRTVRDLHPQLATYAADLAGRLAKSGSYTPSEAQSVIQNLNKSLSSFFTNPTSETVARSGVEARLLGKLRESLDTAIENAGSPGYQALRSEYGALRATEKDVARAVAREAKNLPGGLVARLGNFGASEELLRGVVTGDLKGIATSAAIKAAVELRKALGSPNRAVRRLFEAAEQQGTAGNAPLEHAAAAAIPVAGSVAGGLPPALAAIQGKVDEMRGQAQR